RVIETLLQLDQDGRTKRLWRWLWNKFWWIREAHKRVYPEQTPEAPSADAPQAPRGATAPPPEEVTPLAQLKALVDDLKGNEAVIIDTICNSGGRVPLKDLGLKMKWKNRQDNWNSAKNRLNPKLKEHGWRLGTENNHAVANKLPVEK